jgi:hypothetical protein
MAAALPANDVEMYITGLFVNGGMCVVLLLQSVKLQLDI